MTDSESKEDATTTATPPHNDLFYINERPKIDAGLKSFYSWFLARQMIAENDATSSNTTVTSQPASQQLFSFTPQSILSFTRILSKTINAHIFPITIDRNTTTISRTWNEIQTRKEKPTKWLGRTALAEAWPDMEFDDNTTTNTLDEGQREAFEYFRQEFARLLLVPELSDAKLVWDADGGQQELATRAQERIDRAHESATQKVAATAATIVEEIAE